MDDWKMLYDSAKRLQGEKKLSKFLKVSGVSAALMTASGKIFTGVSLAGACAVGMCAERNAIANMLMDQEYEISKIVAVKDNGKIISPCGVCRECMLQLGTYAKKIEVMVSEGEVRTLGELMPGWWGDQVDG